MIERENMRRGGWRKLACGLILAACGPVAAAQEPAVCGASTGRPGGPVWDASSANAGVGGLHVHRLRACVERRGNRFSAVLVDERGEVNQTIAGTVRGGRVTARRTVMASDNIGERLAGTWDVSPITPYRQYTIVLTNPVLAIILTRSDYRGRPVPYTPPEE